MASSKYVSNAKSICTRTQRPLHIRSVSGRTASMRTLAPFATVGATGSALADYAQFVCCICHSGICKVQSCIGARPIGSNCTHCSEYTPVRSALLLRSLQVRCSCRCVTLLLKSCALLSAMQAAAPKCDLLTNAIFQPTTVGIPAGVLRRSSAPQHFCLGRTKEGSD